MTVQERQALVRDFQRKSRESTKDAPELPDTAQAVLRAKFVLEEALELCAALGVDVELHVTALADQTCDVPVSLTKLVLGSRGPANLVEVVDALRDLEYHIHGTELALGVADATDETFLEVHRSNMEKQRVDSVEKAVKPRGWKPPRLAKVLRKVFPKKALLFRE
jgi:predicted HAD superfamily Cof-like phosphohydrolase